MTGNSRNSRGPNLHVETTEKNQGQEKALKIAVSYDLLQSLYLLPMSHLTETYLFTNNSSINFKLSLFCFCYFCLHPTVLRTYPWFCVEGSLVVLRGIWILMLELTVCKANTLTPIFFSSPKFFSFPFPQWPHISIYYFIYFFPIYCWRSRATCSLPCPTLWASQVMFTSLSYLTVPEVGAGTLPP